MVDSSARVKRQMRPCKGLAGGDAKDEPAAKDPVEDLGSRPCPQRVVSQQVFVTGHCAAV